MHVPLYPISPFHSLTVPLPPLPAVSSLIRLVRRWLGLSFLFPPPFDALSWCCFLQPFSWVRSFLFAWGNKHAGCTNVQEKVDIWTCFRTLFLCVYCCWTCSFNKSLILALPVLWVIWNTERVLKKDTNHFGEVTGPVRVDHSGNYRSTMSPLRILLMTITDCRAPPPPHTSTRQSLDIIQKLP